MNDVAVVGIACRFPGAANPAEFWRNLAAGKESLRQLTPEQLAAAGVPQSLVNHPDYVPHGMFLDGYELFDPGFFGLAPVEGDVMDPQHRQFLECAWEAFEDAGCVPQEFDGAISVFAGSGHNAYLLNNVMSHPEIVANQGFFLLRHTGNDKDFLATRAAYCFDLKGPAVSVQTACSTSLVAIHMAVQSLLNGESDLALAGGVTIELPQPQGYLYKAGEILSVDGHCRPFDASSTGTVFGSGVGCAVLKRLEDAIRDKDYMHAVIKGTAINNDGSQKVSYLAPSVDGQAAVLREALEVGEIAPESVTYLECHGTGTQMGDPIEVAALTQAYATGAADQVCALGSVKSNIGHTDNAAGIAGFIKVVQSLKHRKLAPTLHFERPNPNIDFATTPFHVNATLRDWTSPGPLRGGVTSLGVGGTNAHVLLEEALAPAMPPETPIGPRLLVLSARSESSLDRFTADLSAFLSQRPADLRFADVLYTLATGRRGFDTRRIAIVDDLDDAIDTLDRMDPDEVVTRTVAGPPRDTVFMFAGGGAQYPGMGRGLYETQPVFHDAIDECASLLAGFIDYELRDLLYPPDNALEAAAKELERPSRTLPALFATQYATARLWQSWGVRPSALIGHSMGENTAACIAGVLSLEDALGLVALRGQLFESVPAGGMLSIEIPESELSTYLGDELDVAAVNAPGLSVASGPIAPLTKLQERLVAADIGCQTIHINVAAHSRMLEPILQAFGDYLRGVELHPPQIGIISNRTGAWLTDAEATDPDYWVGHLRDTIRFADGVGRLLANNRYTLLEVGPGKVLASLARLHAEANAEHTIVDSLGRADDTGTGDMAHMTRTLGALWLGRTRIDWDVYFGKIPRRRVPLPTYRFEHTPHFLPALNQSAGENRRGDEVADWMYQPVWHKTPNAAGGAATGPVLVFGSDPLLRALADQVDDVITVNPGGRFAGSAAAGYALQPDVADDYVFLVRDLVARGRVPAAVVFGFGLELQPFAAATLTQDRKLAFDALFYLAQAFAGEDIGAEQLWLLLTKQAQQVAGEGAFNPLGAMTVGAAQVIERELPGVQCRVIDVMAEPPARDWLAGQLAMELDGAAPPGVTAYRGRVRFVQQFARLVAPASRPREPCVRSGAVYLITGGLGGLGLIAAREFACANPVKLVLASRRPAPARAHWPALIASAAPEAAMLRTLLEIEASGSEILLATTDVADLHQVRALAVAITKRFGRLHGIVHAAGVIDDTLIQVKDIGSAERVFAPKVDGTVNLDTVFGFENLDFCMLYGSTSTLAGLPGQIDYAAANAFLDGYAHYAQARGCPQVTSINWPAWNETGMAVAAAAGTGGVRQPPGRPIDHPLLDRVIEEGGRDTVYSTLMNVHRFWLLDEHRMRGGKALIPSAGYIEFARAGFAQIYGEGPVRFNNVANLLPFFVGDGDTRELRLRITGDESDSSFVFFGIDDDDELHYVTGRIGRLDMSAVADVDVDALAARCSGRVQLFDDEDHHPFMQFGDRWRVLRKVRAGVGEAVTELAFDGGYEDELQDYVLHPALLDMATAGAQILIDDYDARSDLFVPIGYGELRFGGRLPARSRAHVSYRRGRDANHAWFDIDLLDEAGRLVLQARNFEMQRVDEAITSGDAKTSRGDTQTNLANVLNLGIADGEGAAALRYVLDHHPGPQVVVSPYPLRHYFDTIEKPFTGSGDVAATAAHDPDADPDIPDVEAALGAHASVAAVIVRSHLATDRSRRLIAHFLPAAGQSVTVSEMRAHARTRLDEALVPRHFVEVHEFERDASGAIDRTAYVDPFAPIERYVAPATSTEKQLARIWQDLLGVARVSRNDNFFDIGGHSLISIRAIVRSEKKLGIKLDQAKMAMMTLEQIADDIDTAKCDAVDGTEANPAENPRILGRLLGKR